MIKLSFECPETHELLTTMSSTEWTSSPDAAMHVVHCPKCSKRHSFSRADAILSFERPRPERDRTLTVMR